MHNKKLKRQYIRHKCLQEIKYSFKQTHDIKAHVLNVSLTALLIRTNHILDIDDEIEIRFLNDKMLIYIMKAIIKFRINNLIGVELIIKNDIDNSFMKSFIKNNINKIKS